MNKEEARRMYHETPPFLDDAMIAHASAQAGLDEASLRTLRDFAARMRADPQRVRVAAAAHHAVYETDAPFDDAVAQADAALGGEAGLLHALLVLDSTRLVRERQAARGVPADGARAINERHGAVWLRVAEHSGNIATTAWMPGWLRTVASGNLHRLGRLEFFPKLWDWPFRAYAHEGTHEVIVLAEAGLTEADDTITGTAVSPGGAVLPGQVRLPRGQWRLALAPGDPVLDMHVPAEGALTIEALRDAMEQAELFFEDFYPEHRFVAYVCDSWLFSPQLEALLGDDSNILRWQREGYMLPGDDDAASFLTFTFGASSIDLAAAPRDTRLRRAVIAHLQNGGALACGGSMLLRRDLPRFGTQPYRQRTSGK